MAVRANRASFPPAVPGGFRVSSLVGARAWPLLWFLGALVSAAALGAIVALDTTTALILVTGAVFTIGIVWRQGLLLVVLIGTLFLQVVTVGGVTISRVAAPIALLVVVLLLLRGNARVALAAPIIWLSAYSFWVIASGLWSTQFDATVNAYGSLGICVAYALAFATLLRTVVDLRLTLYALSIVALGVGVYATATSEGRAGTATGDANYFAAVELVALPIVLVLASETRSRFVRIALYAMAVMIIGAIFSSLSRGGLLGLAVVVAIMLLVPARMFFRARTHKVVVIGFLALGIAAAFSFTSEALTPRVEAIFTPEGRTGSGRLNAWRAAWTSIEDRPILGLGYGAFQPTANELMLRTPGVDLSNFLLRPRGLEAHSAYIGTTAELGVPGLILFLGVMGSTALALRRAAVQAQRKGAFFLARVANALVISLGGWAVASMFLSNETARPLWILVGISLALPLLIAREPASGNSRSAASVRERAAPVVPESR